MQIEAAQALHPREGLRSSPISGVVLTGGDVDALAGLLHLRERHRFTVYAPSRVLAVIADNPIFGVLSSDYVKKLELPFDERIELAGASGPSGLTAVAFTVPAKVPLYLETAGQEPPLTEEGDAVGLEVVETATGKSLFFIPGCAAMTGAAAGAVGRERVGILRWNPVAGRRDDPARRREKTGRRMGHISMSGESGAIAAFQDLGVQRRIFIHINNSNPVLLEDSSERRIAESAGWEIAHDGMEVRL